MSQYYGNTTTNFFKVTDAEEFKAFMQQVKDTELDTVQLWTKEDETGTTLFSFGCYASIEGILSTESRIRKIVFDACAEAYEAGHLTEDVLPVILEDLELNELEYDKESVTGLFFAVTKSSNFFDDDIEYSFDAFITELQKFLPDGEIVVIKESGHEKLRYVGGHVTVITNGDCKYANLDDVAYYWAKQMTQNENIKISYF